MKKAIASRIITNIIAVLVVAIFLAPLYFVIITALKSNTEFLTNSMGLPKTWRFDNFAKAWESAKLGVYALNSLFYTVVCVSCSMILAIFLAFPLARNFFKRGRLIYTAFIAGMFLPSGAIPLWQMIHSVGLYDTRLGYMILMISGGGVTMFFFVSYIKGIPKELDESACIDGCGYIPFIFHILIPIMKPAIASMAVLAAIGVWNEVINSVLFLFNEKYFPITRGLYAFKGQYSIQWGMLCASLIIVACPVLILYMLLQKQIIGGVMAGSVKG